MGDEGRRKEDSEVQGILEQLIEWQEDVTRALKDVLKGSLRKIVRKGSPAGPIIADYRPAADDTSRIPAR